MKKHVIGFGFLAAALFGAACGKGGKGGADAGSGADASGACTDPNHDGGDGSCVPGGVCQVGYQLEADGSCSMATGDMTTVRFLRDGQPVTETAVVFHRADGSVLNQLATDSKGEAKMPVTGSCLATLALVDATDAKKHSLTTIAVTAGQTVEYRLPPTIKPVKVGTVAVTMPGNFTGASAYAVDLGFSSKMADAATAAVAVDVNDADLAKSTTADVIVWALDADGNALAYGSATAVDLSSLAGGAALASVPVAITEWKTDFRSVAVSLTNATAGKYGIIQGNLYLGAIAHAMQPQFFGMIDQTNGAAATLKGPATLGDGVDLMAGQVSFDGSFNAQDVALRVEHPAEVPSAKVFDAATDFLPPVTSIMLDTTDAARPALTFVGASTLQADIMNVDVTWANAAGSYDWTFALPVAASLTVPSLPPTLGPFSPAAGFDGGAAKFFAFDSSAVDGYADALTMLSTNDNLFAAPVGGYITLVGR